MAIDVVFLKQGSIKPLHVNRGPQDRLLAWREGYIDSIQTEEWENSTFDIAHLALKGDFHPLEVFLCLSNDQLDDLINYEFIEKLISATRKYSWGADIYLVVDTSLDYSRELIEKKDSLYYWFEAVYEVGITDIIQVAVFPSDQNFVHEKPAVLRELRAGADRSRKRHEAIYPSGQWRCLHRKEDAFLRVFLDTFETFSDASIPLSLTGNLVTVIEDSVPVKQNRLVDKALISCTTGKHLVAMRHPCQPSDYLLKLAHEKKLHIVRYRGAFELRYLVHLLNSHHAMRSTLQTGKVEEVSIDSNPLFQSTQNILSPSLLVTSFFHPERDPSNCLEAAQEIGHATRRKPAHAEYLVYPAIDCNILPDLIKSMPRDLTVWLHSGHGTKGQGLQEASGKFHPPERWLDCFRVQAGSLALAIFSTCQSITIARRFAEAGVGVAVGFEKDVPALACKLLTAELVGAALRFNGDREMILQAFQAGCAALIAGGYTGLGPTAFYSSR